MNETAEQIIVNIIATELGLGADNVWVRNQTRKIPTGSDLFVVVGMTDSRPIASQSYVKDIGEVTYEIQRVQTWDRIQIDIFSRDNSAITRRWEIMTALKSIYSQQKQEENSFKIFPIPTGFINTSSAEGGSNINRFTLTVSCAVWFEKRKVLSGGDYFDQFKTRVDDANTIGTDEPLIYFENNAQ